MATETAAQQVERLAIALTDAQHEIARLQAEIARLEAENNRLKAR